MTRRNFFASVFPESARCRTNYFGLFFQDREKMVDAGFTVFYINGGRAEKRDFVKNNYFAGSRANVPNAQTQEFALASFLDP